MKKAVGRTIVREIVKNALQADLFVTAWNHSQAWHNGMQAVLEKSRDVDVIVGAVTENSDGVLAFFDRSGSLTGWVLLDYTSSDGTNVVRDSSSGLDSLLASPNALSGLINDGKFVAVPLTETGARADAIAEAARQLASENGGELML
jgi:hypothetical protein